MSEMQTERAILQDFLATLTGGGRNNPNTLTINHDRLAGLVKAARELLAGQEGMSAANEIGCLSSRILKLAPKAGLYVSIKIEPRAVVAQKLITA